MEGGRGALRHSNAFFFLFKSWTASQRAHALQKLGVAVCASGDEGNHPSEVVYLCLSLLSLLARVGAWVGRGVYSACFFSS